MSQLYKSAVRAVHSAFAARLESLLSVDVLFEGEQASAADYALYTDDDEIEGLGSDHDSESLEVVRGLALWGTSALTLMDRAVVVAESLKTTTLVVAGFYHLREPSVEVNAGRTLARPDGTFQRARDLRFRFYLNPNPS